MKREWIWLKPALVGLLLLVLFALVGCKGKEYVVVEKVHTDSVYITKWQRDSVWMHDSVYVKEYTKGDTVYQLTHKWHTKYIEKEVHDTLYQAKVDSIPVPYKVEVPAKLTAWEKVKVSLGGYAIIILIIAIFTIVAFIYLKKGILRR